MDRTRLPLCCYPTKVLFIDDNKKFLDTIKLATAKEFKSTCFREPDKALDYANAMTSRAWDSNVISKHDLHNDPEAFIQKTLNASITKMDNLERFNEISVIIVDYDMPQMNGLEFCKKLKSSSVKKILLTGHVGAEEAVNAFNDGLINYYISKSDLELYKKLTVAIKNLQEQYFLDLTDNLKINAIDANRQMFNDNELSNYISKVIIENNIDEFYFLTNPTRYELKTKTGDVSTLLICSRSEMNEHIRILKEEAAPEWLVECLKTENYVPYFRSIDGFYDQDSFDPNSAVYLAKVIEGREKYYCAYLNNDTAPLSSIFFTSGTNYH